jgi:glutamine---fructose-6-phosphate transaminase (isomerizing)
MCGIFGIISKGNKYKTNYLESDIRRLFLLSESRGKEASGISILRNENILIYKDSVMASDFVKSKTYKKLIRDVLTEPNQKYFAFIGHSRLATNGNEIFHTNNQPIITEKMVGLHNGIIVNENQLWTENKLLNKEYEVDSEIIFRLIEDIQEKKNSIINSVLETFNQIRGQATIAAFSSIFDILTLYTNNGSLYIASNENKSIIIFASEKIILQKFLTPFHLKKVFGSFKIHKVLPNSGYIIDLKTLQLNEVMNNDNKKNSFPYKNRTIKDISLPKKKKEILNSFQHRIKPITIPKSFKDHIKDVNKSIESIRRCNKCILPETMPFISFDKLGICNYCKNYNNYKLKDLKILKNIIKSKVNKKDDPDSVMGISGGRDSCFGLHYAVNELGLKPIAYTYDWGLITDLARRNTSRMVSSLGVEHVLISANIKEKRTFVRKKVLSWLKRPQLGLIPLFQSGDKQYFYLMKKVMRENNIKMGLFTENPLEKTNFKTGFAGVFEGNNQKSRVFDTSLFNKIKLGLYFSKEFLLNPSHINSSIFDTFGGYISSFFVKHNWEFLFQYYNWNEDEVNKTLINNYDWELSPDTSDTWRIGDWNAPFYNYIYYVVSGFTENDTFRSNQIREGVISREKALEKVTLHNQPRWESIISYCNIIEIDFYDTIKIINRIKKMY